jgi:hypothetical protein
MNFSNGPRICICRKSLFSVNANNVNNTNAVRINLTINSRLTHKTAAAWITLAASCASLKNDEKTGSFTGKLTEAYY